MESIEQVLVDRSRLATAVREAWSIIEELADESIVRQYPYRGRMWAIKHAYEDSTGTSLYSIWEENYQGRDR